MTAPKKSSKKTSDKLEQAELRRIESEIQKNQSEAEKFDEESRQLRSPVSSKTLLAGIVAGGLLLVWVLTYFAPIMSKKNELAQLENEIERYRLEKERNNVDSLNRVLRVKNRILRHKERYIERLILELDTSRAGEREKETAVLSLRSTNSQQQNLLNKLRPLAGKRILIHACRHSSDIWGNINMEKQLNAAAALEVKTAKCPSFEDLKELNDHWTHDDPAMASWVMIVYCKDQDREAAQTIMDIYGGHMQTAKANRDFQETYSNFEWAEDVDVCDYISVFIQK